MNQLLVDAGGTRSRWVQTIDNQVTSFEGGALSLHNKELIDIPSGIRDSYDSVIFYGAGCKGEAQKQVLTFLQSRIKGDIQVKTDTEAAALATMGNQSGFIHIFGTGSSVNYWDGKKITNPTVNLGYLWEDFGSGFDLGRTLIQWWKRGKLNNKDEQTLLNRLGTLEGFISKVYQQKNIKTYVASLALILDILQIETRNQLIEERFSKYISVHKQILDMYPQSSHHFSGGIAKTYQNSIHSTFFKNNYLIGTFISSPLEGFLSDLS